MSWQENPGSMQLLPNVRAPEMVLHILERALYVAWEQGCELVG
jgi:hypothetical protein